MCVFIHLTMFFLFITIFGSTLAVPLLRSQDSAIASSSRVALIQRVRRQGPVVQPSWSLNSDFGLFEDYNVRVTDEKLEETEAIRDYIQGTVDNGTYVVELDEGDFEEEGRSTDVEEGEEIPAEDISQPEPELEPEVAPPSPPAPRTEPLQPPPPPSEPTPKTKQTNEPKPAANKPSNFFSRFKFTPRRNSQISDRPFFIWLRKSFSSK
ncbi:protein TsetseEP-like [Eupeodes corollae]|uniref:protein TsetseEP-like n=1 Tax=Eupeodes corollae TaxID=290404 RepID=UPI0024902C2C|nr:protein TsetseEP-like [Eupeodes corollae]